MKKLIAFDLGGTLAPSKSHFNPKMVKLFSCWQDTALALRAILAVS